jgi:tetratricopeptide (TPR) repeat protein
MPPDDPVSHQFMHQVDCKKGWPFWHQYGDTPFVENPDWEKYLPYDENGVVVLDQSAAMEMALLHSREYQRVLENLYLSALNVTLERFRFDVQFFGGNSTASTIQGPLSGEGDKSRRLTTDTDIGAERLFATGSQLLVEFANSVVWQFAGPDRYTSVNLLNFSLLQPLLRGAGRAVVLEQLTDAERALLANVRQFQRFRQGFYLSVIAGGSAGTEPSPAGFAVGSFNVTGPIRGGGGYFGLLQQKIEIRNQRVNVLEFRENAERLQAFYDAQRVDRFQLDETTRDLYNSQVGLLSVQANYETAVDRYKIDLGLPPQLKVRIEDPFLDQFDLIDPELIDTRETVAVFLDQLREPASAGEPVVGPKELTDLVQRVRRHLEMVQRDLEVLVAALPERRESFRRLAGREEFRNRDVNPGLLDIEALETRAAGLGKEFTEAIPAIEGTLGVALFRAGEWQGAADALGKSIQKRDNQKLSGADVVDWITDQFYLAMAFWQMGRQEDARQWYERAIRKAVAMKSDDARLRRLALEASALIGLENPLLEPGDWSLLAIVYLELGRQQQARAWCQRAFDWIVENPNHPERERLRRLAAEASARIGMADPRATPEDWFYLGLAYWQLGRRADARLWSQRAIQWTADNQPDNITLRRLAALATAITDISNPRATPEDWFFLVSEYWRLGRQEDARLWYQKAVRWALENQPDNEKLRRLAAETSARTCLDPLATPEDWFYLAMAYFQLQRRQDARLWYEKAVQRTVENQPDNERLRQLADQASKLADFENPLPPPEEPLPPPSDIVPLPESPQLRLDLQRQRLIRLVTRFKSQMIDLSLIQAGARLDTPTLVPVDLSPEEALELARQHRPDWMNARAALVDQWRQIEVVANRLEADLNFTFNGDVTQTSSTLNRLHNTTGRLQVGLEFDAPLTRLAERNEYRRVLIDYQRARREYYLFEDQVSRVLRETLRLIRLNALQFELTREAIRANIGQVVQVQLELEQPPRPGVDEPSVGRDTSRRVATSLDSLLRGQNNFLNLWLGYEVLRRSLDFDLGTMQLDDQGMWIDPGSIQGSNPPSSDNLEVIPPGLEIVPRAPQAMLDVDLMPLKRVGEHPHNKEVHRLPKPTEAKGPIDRVAAR